MPGGGAEAPDEAARATAAPSVTPIATPQATATLSATVACGKSSQATNLLMFSEGAATELVIEWKGGPAEATGWQYRTRLWGVRSHPEQGWGARRDDTTQWTDIPTSAAETCSYRITGLRSRQAYEAQVRAKLPGEAKGVESNVADGSTQYDDGSAPTIGPDAIVKGDGRTRWQVHGLRWTIIIPDGVLIRGGRGWINGGGGVGIYDHESGSSLGFSDYGTELARTVVLQPGRDVATMFDEIVASVDPPVQQLTPAQYAVGWGTGKSDAHPVGDAVVRISTSRGGAFELTIPTGERLEVRGPFCHPRPECFEPGSPLVLILVAVVHVNTGSELVAVIEHIGPDGFATDGPWEVSRVVTVYGEERGKVNAVFDAVVDSLHRTQEPSDRSR